MNNEAQQQPNNEDTHQEIRVRFAGLLLCLQGNRATSLTLVPCLDPLLCQLAHEHFSRLCEALFSNQSIFTVKVSADFLNRVGADEQENFLRALWRIKTLEVVQLGLLDETPSIPLRVLAKSLQSVDPVKNARDFRRFLLRAFIIRSPEEVKELAKGLVSLGRVFCVAEVLFNFSVQVHDAALESGLLDPLVDVMANMKQAHRHTLNATAHSGTTSLISGERCKRLMGAFTGNETIFQRGFPSIFDLTGLGLSDAVVRAMTDALKVQHHLGEAYLQNNPRLTSNSVDCWLRAIDHSENLSTVQFGVEDWDATVKLHVKLNGLGRREAIQNGLYSDRRVWSDWLAELATGQERLVQKFHFSRYCRDNDALVLSSLYLTVRSQPP